jgi:hypothetical protein
MRLDTLVRAARTRLARCFACTAALAQPLPIQAQAQCITESLARSGIASARSTFLGYSPDPLRRPQHRLIEPAAIVNQLSTPPTVRFSVLDRSSVGWRQWMAAA